MNKLGGVRVGLADVMPQYEALCGPNLTGRIPNQGSSPLGPAREVVQVSCRRGSPGIIEDSDLGFEKLGARGVIQYGGKFLGGGTKIEIADGDWSPVGVMAAEFESLAKAKEWYNSPEYQAVVAGRLESTVGGLIFVEAG